MPPMPPIWEKWLNVAVKIGGILGWHTFLVLVAFTILSHIFAIDKNRSVA